MLSITRTHTAASGRKLAIAPLAAALMVCLPAVEAATILVNDADGGPVAGKCSLPDAAKAINTGTATNGCAAGDGNGDTIDLAFFTVPTTISFDVPLATDGKSAIGFSQPATLRGPTGTDGKALVTIQRSATSGVNFRVIGTSADLSIENVNLGGGFISGRGSGLYASGTANLEITNAIISGNSIVAGSNYSGGGVSADHGNITLDHCTVSDNHASKNGGGVYSAFAGIITMASSTISGNTAAIGGGVYSFSGSVVADASTVSGNGGSVGGIYAYQNVRLTNSTVANNDGDAVVSLGNHSIDRGARGPQTQAGSGGIVDVRFSTIAGNNGDGITGVGGISFSGSIDTGNTGNNLNVFLGSAMSVSIIYPSIVGGHGDGGALLDCDPKLAALADNGGPTETMALLPGSCAIDAGAANAPPTIPSDQRGARFARTVGAGIDIGAFEVQEAGERIFYDGFGT
jgi:hypothetical protein